MVKTYTTHPRYHMAMIINWQNHTLYTNITIFLHDVFKPEPWLIFIEQFSNYGANINDTINYSN
jgi:hypothetical protein